jgi:hypothetical protein
MTFDVESLVAPWRSRQESLGGCIARILGDVRTVRSVQMVVFATNSARRPSGLPSGDGIEVRYLVSVEAATQGRWRELRSGTPSSMPCSAPFSARTSQYPIILCVCGPEDVERIGMRQGRVPRQLQRDDHSHAGSSMS